MPKEEKNVRHSQTVRIKTKEQRQSNTQNDESNENETLNQEETSIINNETSISAPPIHRQ